MNRSSSKPHPILAGFTDFYILSAIALTILALGKSILIHLIAVPIILSLFIILLTTVVIYHGWLSKKYKWLSPGEKISGKTLKNKKKEWINPYNVNRWLLFSAIITTTVLMGSEINHLLDLKLTTLATIIKSSRIAVIFWAMVMIGQGKIRGAWINITLFAIASLLGGLIYKSNGNPLAFQGMIFNGLVTILWLVSYFRYRKV